MPTQCPQCLSPFIRERHLGKQIGAVVGTFVGALSSVVLSASSLRLVAIKILPVGTMGVPGIVASVIAWGLSGSAAGAALGEVIDAEFLDTHLCLSCSNTFRADRFERPMWDNL